MRFWLSNVASITGVDADKLTLRHCVRMELTSCRLPLPLSVKQTHAKCLSFCGIYKIKFGSPGSAPRLDGLE